MAWHGMAWHSSVVCSVSASRLLLCVSFVVVGQVRNRTVGVPYAAFYLLLD